MTGKEVNINRVGIGGAQQVVFTCDWELTG